MVIPHILLRALVLYSNVPATWHNARLAFASCSGPKDQNTLSNYEDTQTACNLFSIPLPAAGVNADKKQTCVFNYAVSPHKASSWLFPVNPDQTDKKHFEQQQQQY